MDTKGNYAFKEDRPCVYVPTSDLKIIRSGCNPSRSWIPQTDMKYCPFCGGTLKVLRIATTDEMPPPLAA